MKAPSRKTRPLLETKLDKVDISEEGDNTALVSFKGRCGYVQVQASAGWDPRVPGLYYFEVEHIRAFNGLRIFLCTPKASQVLYGVDFRSGRRIANGQLFSVDGRIAKKVGIGFNTASKEIFYTVDDELQGLIGVYHGEQSLFPVVRVGDWTTVRVRFHPSSFEFDLSSVPAQISPFLETRIEIKYFWRRDVFLVLLLQGDANRKRQARIKFEPFARLIREQYNIQCFVSESLKDWSSLRLYSGDFKTATYTMQIKLENEESSTLIGLYDEINPVLTSSVRAPNKFGSITTHECNSLEEVFLFAETVQFKHKWQSVYRDHFKKAADEIRLQSIKKIVGTTCKCREMDAATKVETVKREIVRMMMTLEGRTHAATQAALKKRKDEDFRESQRAGEEAAKRVHQAKEDRIAKRKALHLAKVEALAQAKADAEFKLNSEIEEKAKQGDEKEKDGDQVTAEQKEISTTEGSPADSEETESGEDLTTDGNDVGSRNADSVQPNVNEDTGYDMRLQPKNIYSPWNAPPPAAAYFQVPFSPYAPLPRPDQFYNTLPSFMHPHDIRGSTHSAESPIGASADLAIRGTGEAETRVLKDVNPSEWTCDEVCHWMTSLQLSEDYSSVIRNNRITGDVLLLMNKADWKELGVGKFGDLKKLESRCQQLAHATPVVNDISPSIPANQPSNLLSTTSPTTNFISPSIEQHTTSSGPSSPLSNNNIKHRSYAKVLRLLSVIGVGGVLAALVVWVWPLMRRRSTRLTHR